MTPSISILTPLAPTIRDAHPLSASEGHCLKRHRGALAPFGVPVTGPGSVFISNSNSGTSTSSDAYDGAALGTSTRQWTGMPIRAIVPLPRRCRHGTLGPSHSDANGANANGPASNENNGTSHQVAKIGFGQPPARSAIGVANDAHTHFWDEDGDEEDELGYEDDAVESGEGMELDQGMNDKDMDDLAEGGSDEGQSQSRCCSYESITAAEGLSAYSFEELRVECYAQSLIARGTRPPPVAHPSLAIPPAFAPRTLLRIQPRSS